MFQFNLAEHLISVMGRNSELTSRRTFFHDSIENITKVLGYSDSIGLDMQIFVDNSVHGLRKKNQRRLDRLGKKAEDMLVFTGSR